MHDYDVEILKPAWEELDHIADYHLAAVGKQSAKKVTDGILDLIDQLHDFPYSFPAVRDEELAQLGYRMAIYKKYLIIYRIIDKTVFVYHIVNGATNYPSLLK